MAAALLLHLEAVRKFAVSMGVHRGKEDVLGAQFSHTREVLQSMTLTLDEAEKVVTAAGAVPWQASQSEELMALVSQRVSKAMLVGKSKLQDYTALGSYFSAPQWQQLLQEGPTEPKLDLIIQQATNLGLKFPTERTVQYITSLSLYVGEGFAKAMNMPAAMKFQYLQHIKRLMKGAPGEPIPLFVLPAAPVLLQKEFPKVFEVAFMSGPPVKCGIDEVQLGALTITIPMRCSSAKLSTTPSQQRNQHGGMESQIGASGSLVGQNPQALVFMMLERFMGMMQGRNAGQQEQAVGLKMLTPTKQGSAMALPQLAWARSGSNVELGDTPAMEVPQHRGASKDDCTSLPGESPRTTPRPEAQPVDTAMSSSVEQRPAGKKGTSPEQAKQSLDAATRDILKRIEARDAMKDQTKKGTSKAADQQASRPKAKQQARGATAQPAQKRQRTSTEPVRSGSRPGEKKPYFTVEHTRRQVMCRTGLKGPGDYHAIKFGDGPEGAEQAIKAATKWVEKQKGQQK